jgi:demethylmenaquinone methyltransferase/2-methoxy-6-polyprenyl-1,4-benzoquinol methylase
MIESLPQAERAEEVRSMFGAIAGRYDRTNQVLSGGMHHLWRRAAVAELAAGGTDRVADVCCGTGDLALTIAGSLEPDGEVVGIDFCPEMVELAEAKLESREQRGGRISFRAGDATSLPFERDRFDGATVAFGIRNVVDPVAGLTEMARVVRPGGRVVVLEFGQPGGWLMGPSFRLYSRWIMPTIGGLITGNRAAYEYLPRTSAAFPAGSDFVDRILNPAGLTSLRSRRLFGGVAWIYVAEVPA